MSESHLIKSINTILEKLKDNELIHKFNVLKAKTLNEFLKQEDPDPQDVAALAEEIFNNPCHTKYKPSLLQELLTYDETVHPIIKKNILKTALFSMITRNKIEKLEILLKYKVLDINVVNADNYSPLLEAVSESSIDAVTALLKHPQCNINFQKPGNRATPLFLAVQRNQIDIVSKLLDYGADINLPLERCVAGLLSTAETLKIKDNMQNFILQKLSKNNLNEINHDDIISITPLEMARMMAHHEITNMLQLHQKKQGLALMRIPENIAKDSIDDNMDKKVHDNVVEIEPKWRRALEEARGFYAEGKSFYFTKNTQKALLFFQQAKDRYKEVLNASDIDTRNKKIAQKRIDKMENPYGKYSRFNLSK